MGLPRKHRRVKLTWPEYIGLALLLIFFLVVVLTYPELDQMNWKRTTARVIGVSVRHDARTVHSPIGTSNNGVVVLYQYDTGSRTVTDEWSSNWLNTPILNRAAPTIFDAATRTEVVDLHAIAKVAEKARLSSTGNTPIEITDPRVGNPEVSRTVRGEDFYGVLSERRKALSGVTPEMITADEVNRLLPNIGLPLLNREGPTDQIAFVSPFMAEKPKLVQKAMQLKVRFDPRNPENSALDYPGFNLHMPVLLLDLALALLLVRYFARTYPSLKLQGY